MLGARKNGMSSHGFEIYFIIIYYSRGNNECMKM
jgi:hypothetical protein